MISYTDIKEGVKKSIRDRCRKEGYSRFETDKFIKDNPQLIKDSSIIIQHKMKAKFKI